MAKIEDVVVSDRQWRWTSCIPGYNRMRTDPFVIVGRGGDGHVTYRYVFDGRSQVRDVVCVAAHADPDSLPEPAKCEPGCGPARPCMTTGECPGFRPECTGLSGFDGWAHWHGHPLMAMFDEVTRDKAPPPDLRCGRDLACGLFRVP